MSIDSPSLVQHDYLRSALHTHVHSLLVIQLMAKTQTVLQVFVASPGDIVEEREIIDDVIGEFNVTWGGAHNVRLELLKWETHTRPGFGEDAQDVINDQIGDEYDIFIGIMWGRFGTPTGRSESGTEEEFERAYRRLSGSSQRIEMMFYFKDAGIPPSKLDPTQLAKVQEFKSRISSEHGGLYHEFTTPDQFHTKVRIHLSQLVQHWMDPPEVAVQAAQPGSGASSETAIDPLANLATLADDNEDGLLELNESSIEAMDAVNLVLQRITDAIFEVGEKMEQRAGELNALSAGVVAPDKNAVKSVANDAANDLEVFVRKLSVEIPEFYQQHSTAMDSFGQLAMMSVADLDESPEDVRSAFEMISRYRTEISSASETLVGFRDSTANLPRMTTAFNRARKRATAILDDLLVQLQNTDSQAADLEDVLSKLAGE